jgi:hypothetical protein
MNEETLNKLRNFLGTLTLAKLCLCLMGGAALLCLFLGQFVGAGGWITAMVVLNRLTAAPPNSGTL